MPASPTPLHTRLISAATLAEHLARRRELGLVQRADGLDSTHRPGQEGLPRREQPLHVQALLAHLEAERAGRLDRTGAGDARQDAPVGGRGHQHAVLDREHVGARGLEQLPTDVEHDGHRARGFACFRRGQTLAIGPLVRAQPSREHECPQRDGALPRGEQVVRVDGRRDDGRPKRAVLARHHREAQTPDGEHGRPFT